MTTEQTIMQILRTCAYKTQKLDAISALMEGYDGVKLVDALKVLGNLQAMESSCNQEQRSNRLQLARAQHDYRQAQTALNQIRIIMDNKSRELAKLAAEISKAQRHFDDLFIDDAVVLEEFDFTEGEIDKINGQPVIQEPVQQFPSTNRDAATLAQ